MLILPIYLKQVLTNEKSDKSEKAILTPSSGPQRNLKQLFLGANSKSKIVASVWLVSGTHKKFFLFHP
jgi:hypothetical protein